MSAVLDGAVLLHLTPANNLFPEPVTVALWAKLTETGGDQTLFSYARSNSSQMQLAGHASGLNKARTYLTGNTSAHYVESDVEFSRDVWQHFAFTVVGPDDVRVFVNGTKKTGDPPSATDYREDLYDFFTLGGWKTSGEFNFVVGKLSYAAAWNKALSDAEVAALQTSPPDAVAVSDLLSYWRLQNNGEDSVGAADLSAIGTGSLTWDSDEPNLAGGSTLIFTDRSQRVRGYQAADLARLQLR